MAFVLAPACARAEWLDPTTLHIGGTVPTGGGDPNQIGGSGLVNIYQNQTSAPNLLQPWLLIVGIANDNGSYKFGALPTVTSYNPYSNTTGVLGSALLGGTSPMYGGTWNSTTGFAGTLTAGAEVYSTLKLEGPTDKSNSFTNWSAAEQTVNGVTATSFGIYVFEIYAELDGNGNVAIQFDPSTLLPTGSYAIAYGQAPANGGKDMMLYDTPFTEAGLTGVPHLTTPAPSSALLVGAGAVSLFGFTAVRRRQRAPAAA